LDTLFTTANPSTRWHVRLAPTLQEGKDGELAVKEEYRAKLKYLDETAHEIWQDHSEVITAVLENEPGKLN